MEDPNDKYYEKRKFSQRSQEEEKEKEQKRREDRIHQDSRNGEDDALFDVIFYERILVFLGQHGYQKQEGNIGDDRHAGVVSVLVVVI